MSENLERFRHLADGLSARVEKVPAQAWGNQSPCAEWTARDVMAHVIGNCWAGLDRLAGVEHVSRSLDDVAVDWAAARAAVEEALADPARAGAPVDSPFGPMPYEMFVARFQCLDMLIHTWDVARATGGDENVDPVASAQALSGLRSMGDALRGPGLFKAAVPPPAGADAITELMSFCGRQV